MKMLNLFKSHKSVVRNAPSEFTRHKAMVYQTEICVIISYPYDEITRNICSTAVAMTYLDVESFL